MASISGSNGNNNIVGTNDNDTIAGNGGKDTIFAESGNDLLYGGDKDDKLYGATGNDILYGGDDKDDLYGGDGDDTLFGEEDKDGLFGGDGNDVIFGGDDKDDIFGGAGNDILDGGDNKDKIYGGDGDDTLIGGDDKDDLDGGDGIDTVDYSSSGSAVTVDLDDGKGDDGDAEGDKYDSIENAVGSAYNDRLIGDDEANSLYGGAGTDTIWGDDGNDSLDGGDGRDTLYGGDDNDTLTGGAGDDLLFGGDGDDTLEGGAGADTLNGNAGMDYIDYSASDEAVSINLSTGSAVGGDAEGDQLSGVDGIFGTDFDDTLIGFNNQGLVDDVYTNEFFGGAGNDVLDGMGGNDTLDGGAGNDTILGGSGDDSLAGGSGGDTLFGGDGSDTIIGGEGDDTLFGGAGADTLVGGAGSDVFEVESRTDGIGDVIDGGAGNNDTLALTGSEPYTVTYDATDPQSGTVNFLDDLGNITGSLSFSNIENVVMCFTPGTLIETKSGPVKVEALTEGDWVLTRDNGYQPVRWIGRTKVAGADLKADPSLQPILIKKGALGPNIPDRDMMVSRQHRMLMASTRTELLFCEPEVLVRATHLTGLDGVFEAILPTVTYLHLMFDQHQVVMGDGAWTESFQPGDRSLGGMDADQRIELFKIFPSLARLGQGTDYDAARPTLRSFETRALLAS